MPPSSAGLDAVITQTAEANGLPVFAAHMTLIGSVGEDEDSAKEKLAGLAGSGAVPVSFMSVECGETDGAPAWNQVAAAVAEESAQVSAT